MEALDKAIAEAKESLRELSVQADVAQIRKSAAISHLAVLLKLKENADERD